MNSKAKQIEIEIDGPSQASQMPAVQTASENTAIIQMIERVAKDPSIDIDRFERLLAMQERVMEKNAKSSYMAALSELQADLPVVGRRGQIEIRAKDNKGERTGVIIQSTAYALWEDINEAIKEPLKRHGFALSFRVTREGDRVNVTGILSHRDGHSEETTLPAPLDTTGSKNNVQAVGSSISYGKRYTAGLLLNLTSRGEDDDGKKAGDAPTISDEQVDEISKLLTETKSNLVLFLKKMKIESLTEIRADQFEGVKALINETAKKRAEREGKAQ